MNIELLDHIIMTGAPFCVLAALALAVYCGIKAYKKD